MQNGVKPLLRPLYRVYAQITCAGERRWSKALDTQTTTGQDRTPRLSPRDLVHAGNGDTHHARQAHDEEEQAQVPEEKICAPTREHLCDLELYL